MKRAGFTLRVLIVAIGVPILVCVQGALGGDACVADCDGSGGVTVDEIVTSVNIALGMQARDTCIQADANGDGAVTVEEVVAAVDSALSGCAEVSPTVTPTPEQTPVPPQLETGARAVLNNPVALDFGLAGAVGGGRGLAAALMRGGAASLPSGEVACSDPETGETGGRVFVQCFENAAGPTMVFTGTECVLEAGIVFDGELRFTLPEDFTCDAFDFLLNGPIPDARLRTEANAALTVSDLATGETFTRVYDGFVEIELCTREGLRIIEQSGATELECIGRLVIQTVASLVYPPDDVCPAEGQVRLTVELGATSVRYRPGQIEFDLDDDDTFDSSTPCGEPSLRGCF